MEANNTLNPETPVVSAPLAQSTDIPQTEPAIGTPAPVKKKSNTGKILVALFILIFLIILGVGAFLILKFTSNSNNNSNTPASFANTNTSNTPAAPQNNPAPTPQPQNVVTADKIYYVEAHNIFVMDLATKSATQLTANSSATSSTVDIKGMKVIDDNTLGYGQCETVTGDFNCDIDAVDIPTKVITKLKELPAAEMLLNLNFYSKDKYAYLITTDSVWQFNLINSGTKTILEEVALPSAYGRGGFEEDSDKIEFSPNGNYVFQISTSNPKNGFDFNTNVYNLPSNTKDMIVNSTQPDWLDNSNIVFRKYDKAAGVSDGLYTYNVTSKIQQKLNNTTTTSYKPEALKDTQKVLNEDSKLWKLYLYDISTHTNQKIADNATEGFWISPKLIGYRVTQACSGDSCFGNSETKGISIYNTDTGVTTSLDARFESIYQITSMYK